MFRPKSTLEQWRIFQAVVEYGGYAQAAEKLNKSQSSLNHVLPNCNKRSALLCWKSVAVKPT